METTATGWLQYGERGIAATAIGARVHDVLMFLACEIGCHGDDRYSVQARDFKDSGRAINAAYDRHLDVHRDVIKVISLVLWSKVA